MRRPRSAATGTARRASAAGDGAAQLRAPALSAMLGRSAAMPRIQTLIVAASSASRKGAVRSSNGAGAGGQERAGGRPTARRAAPRTSACRRDLLALPHAREIDGVLAPHHGIEQESHRPAR